MINRVAEIALPLPLNKTFYYLIPENLENISIGKRVVVNFRNQKRIGYVINISDINTIDFSQEKLKPIISIIDDEPLLTHQSIQLALWFHRYFLCSLGDALQCILPTNLKNISKIPEEPKDVAQPFYAPTLTPKQKEIFEIIKKSINNQTKFFLLFGATASGKTEIYFKVIEYLLDKNKSSIFLLPEIFLTTQFELFLKTRFPNQQIAIWHSGVKQTLKSIYYKKLLRGEIKILMGARSSVFLPVKNLGAIIVDEEHDHSYKQENYPFFHTRDIVIERCKKNNCVGIFGSATPSVESYYLAQKGEWELLKLEERYSPSPFKIVPPPTVTILDLKKEKREGYEFFTKKLIDAINKRLLKNEQIILFINRKGFSTIFKCTRCGWMAKCPNCGTSLVLHLKEKEYLRCHSCVYRILVPEECPDCLNKKFVMRGAGTQKIAKEFQKIYSFAKVLRVDKDNIKKFDDAGDFYKKIITEEINTIVGTQMIGKGFHFPKLSLVGVIDADLSLHFPDFRCGEKNFQLLLQLIGRAGRGEIQGEVIIQTHYPNHYAIKFAAKNDYEGFYTQELEYRRKLNYPPFCQIANIVLSGKNKENVYTESKILYQKLQGKIKPEIKIFEPVEPYYEKIRKKYRIQIILKGENQALRDFLFEFVFYKPKKGVELKINVEPYNML